MSNIEALLRERLAFLEPLRLEVIDDSALHAGHAGAREGGHYRLLIISPLFSGKTTLQRHRIIYDALGELMRSRIHALSIRSLTPEEAP
ncbi:BolA family protein [Propionivibrio sp.]|uniref:BolA family protein n=1 Tax=Propionivibrio sp. TaxID=2212460 RepID=UPI00272EE1D1|nr:BolA family protein [Propionivibrio sp.]